MFSMLARISICLLLILPALPGQAQELEPRSFNNVPIGLTFLGLGAVRSDGELSTSPSTPIEDMELTIDGAALALSHTFALAGSSSKLDMVATRVCYEGSAIFRGEFVEGRRCEYGDPSFKLTWNFLGAPALRPQEFGTWDPGLVVGASVAVGVPVGTYNPEHLINGGTNTWRVKPSLGMSKRVGRWQWEAKASMTWFEDNDNFFGGIQVEQDLLYQLSGHLIYNLKRGSWLSLDANYFTGGRTTKDGERSDDRQDNSRWGFTWSKPLGQRHIVKIYASTGVVTRIGNDFENYGLGWVYRL